MQDKALTRYLESWAEPEADIDRGIEGEWRHVVTIPAYRESWPELHDALSALATERCLAIIVANTPTADEVTTRFVNDALRAGPVLWKDGHLSLIGGDRHDILLVDRASDGHLLPAKQGVGLARKIGADIACSLIRRGNVQTPVIHCTDADVVLPENYFDIAEAPAAAWLYAFRHAIEGPLQRVADIYELSLFHYVNGLARAGSPYAFMSIGSCMAVDALAYAQVRGFPRRTAAEDFYLLNKLAKVGAIRQRESPSLVLSGRRSDRVPFGTGAAVTRLSDSDAGRTPLFDAERCFDELAGLLEIIQTPGQRHLCSPVQDSFLESAGFASVEARISSTAPSPQHYRRAINEWFDGFRTMKFIHHVRAQCAPAMTLEELVGTSDGRDRSLQAVLADSAEACFRNSAARGITQTEQIANE